LFFLIGAVIGAYNIWMTIRMASQTADELADRPELLPAGAALQQAE